MSTEAISSSKSPTHADIAERIMSLLRQENLKPGDRLPSERDLSKRLGVTHQQARQAILLLGRNDRLERRVGSGTYLHSNLEAIEAGLVEWVQKEASGCNGVRVGVILLPKQNAFSMRLLDELHRLAGVRGVELLLRTANSDYVGLTQAVRGLAQDGCVSLILPLIDAVATTDIVRFALDSPIPVSLSHRILGLESNFFEVAQNYGSYDYCIARLQVSYLLALGRKKLAYFGPIPKAESHSPIIRVGGFTCSASEHGLSVRFALLSEGPHAMDRCMESLRKGDVPDGICCYDDDYALRFLAAVQTVGWNVPQDISVIGMNNIDLAAHSHPSLTSIHFDYSYAASGMLDHALNYSRLAPGHTDTERHLSLIVRESCGGIGKLEIESLQQKLSMDCSLPITVIREQAE